MNNQDNKQTDKADMLSDTFRQTESQFQVREDIITKNKTTRWSQKL